MTSQRQAPIEMGKDEFKEAGYLLIDTIAAFLDTIREKKVTTGELSKELEAILGNDPLPDHGTPAKELFTRASDLLLNHSLFNGHPRFFGYITSSPAPIGALADLLAASVNANVGANILSPMATEIEKQTVRWLAELIGVSPDCGGILVSGGNMANFTAFLAARTAKAPHTIKEEGICNDSQKLTIYCPKSTHTWIEKAVVLFGLGTKAIRWIPVDQDFKMDMNALETTLQEDLRSGCHPLMVIGTAGDVSTGAVDDLKAIATLCKTYDLWFHVDGAYGLPAAVIPELKPLFAGIEEADSIAIDPHKWLYSPLEAGCTLVKDSRHLTDTFSSHPVYYNFDSRDEYVAHNFYEYGIQNSRGFRALKVWMALQQAGRSGYEQMIREDILLSRMMYELADIHPELQAMTQNLSIATFRYMPVNIADIDDREGYLNKLNEMLLNELQARGEVFTSNAVIDGRYCLRCCIVNFRTSQKDIEETIDIIVREGRRIHHELQSKVEM
ncbi:MAG TPA: aminotransferase class V-fold PLP-dependent enzyme [Prolixibacteraceae bacterium]|nr:aminotransferase class V-fold PLP-dependent enzyme [Prolixibacteraceae bacterium]